MIIVDKVNDEGTHVNPIHSSIAIMPYATSTPNVSIAGRIRTTELEIRTLRNDLSENVSSVNGVNPT